MTEILYRSRRLEVRRVVSGDRRCQAVTFDSFHEPHGIDRPGFGEAFFKDEFITAVHVLSHRNDWFQYAEMASVLELIRRECADAEHLLSYGSSMGGYAALRFANAVGAHVALALSPQYSLDRGKVPFETRWAQEQRRIRFLPTLDGPIAPGPRRIVAYDPSLAQDQLHVDRLTTEAEISLLPLPHAGHPVGPFLADAKLLRPLVMTALDGSFTPARFLRAAHIRRTTSPQWLATLAARQPSWRTGCAVALAGRAAAIAPDSAVMLDAHARMLAAAGRFDEAVATHRRAIAIEPIVDYLWGLSKTWFAAGDLAASLAVARQLQALAPKTAGYHAWAAKIRESQGDLQGTVDELRKARRYDRLHRAYRYKIRKLRWQLLLTRVRRALLGARPNSDLTV